MRTRLITPEMIDVGDFGRFFQSDDPAECWVWTGTLNDRGYGTYQLRGVYRGGVKAHRVAFVLANGEIPNGFVIDHLCRNRSCVNPAHMETVSNAVNILRGEGAPAKHARKTHCSKGHEYTPESTKRDSRGSRVCRTCHPYDRPGRPLKLID